MSSTSLEKQQTNQAGKFLLNGNIPHTLMVIFLPSIDTKANKMQRISNQDKNENYPDS
jgi:hypothetical protein